MAEINRSMLDSGPDVGHHALDFAAAKAACRELEISSPSAEVPHG